MPDFTTQSFWCCPTASHWSARIDGHLVQWCHTDPGATVQFDFRCDCKGFQFRRLCKHITKAEGLRCGWQQFVHGGEPVDGKCPRCGEPATAERHAV